MSISRHAEQKCLLDEIVQLADAEQVDAVVVAGDIYDTYRPGNDSEQLLYRTLKRLTKNNTRPVLVIAGNHDSPDKVTVPSGLASQLGIFMLGKPFQVPDAEFEDGDPETTRVLKIAEGFVEVQIPGNSNPLRVLMTPFASPSRITLQADADTTAHEQVVATLKAHWQDLANTYCDSKGVNLLVSHQFMLKRGGTRYEEDESERRITTLGGADALYTDMIPDGIQYVALGHLHSYIEVQREPMPVIYSSSPMRMSMSEAGQTKQVVIVDLQPGKPAQWYKRELTTGRQLIRHKAASVADALVWLSQHKEAIVELSVECEHGLTSSEVANLKNAHDYIVGTPIPIIQNATDIQLAQTDRLTAYNNQDRPALFRQFFTSRKGYEPSAELVALFTELMDEKLTGTTPTADTID